MGNTLRNDKELIGIAKSIVNNIEYIKLKNIRHHRTTRYNHSIRVAYISYRIARVLRLNKERIVKGALLHDFFYEEKQRSMFNKHPKLAMIHAIQVFGVLDVEIDIIEKHMFPVTISLPRYRESWIVCLVDKAIAIREFCKADKQNYIILDISIN